MIGSVFLEKGKTTEIELGSFKKHCHLLTIQVGLCMEMARTPLPRNPQKEVEEEPSCKNLDPTPVRPFISEAYLQLSIKDERKSLILSYICWEKIVIVDNV